MTLKEVHTQEEYRLAADLFREYAKEIGIDLEFQNFQKELADLRKQYSKPEGTIWLAYNENNTAVGCVAVRKLEESICELKRMYIRKEARGMGLGKQLLAKSITTGIQLGYKKMRLDTLSTMHPAIHLYKSVGFYEIDSYRFNPFDEAKYFELALK